MISITFNEPSTYNNDSIFVDDVLCSNGICNHDANVYWAIHVDGTLQ